MAAVLAACGVGSLGLALSARSASAADEVPAVAGCAAAGQLESSATVAVVDSGIDRSAVPDGTVIGSRVDLTGDRRAALAPHGTEMASIVAAGAPSARLLDIRVLDASGSGSALAVADGIDAARRSGADVLNVSAAVPASEPAIREAVGRAVAGGAIVVLAAGNEARDLSADRSWRSLAADPCVVLVGAVGRDGERLGASNRGAGVVEVWAPGEDVAARGLGGDPTAVTGTSPAAAAVTAQLVGS